MRTLPTAAAAVVLLLLLLAGVSHAAPRVLLVAGGADAPPDRRLRQPFGVEFDAKGNLLIVEFASRLLSLAPDGKLATICGDGIKGDAGDGGGAGNRRDLRKDTPARP